MQQSPLHRVYAETRQTFKGRTGLGFWDAKQARKLKMYDIFNTTDQIYRVPSRL